MREARDTGCWNACRSLLGHKHGKESILRNVSPMGGEFGRPIDQQAKGLLARQRASARSSQPAAAFASAVWLITRRFEPPSSVLPACSCSPDFDRLYRLPPALTSDHAGLARGSLAGCLLDQIQRGVETAIGSRQTWGGAGIGVGLGAMAAPLPEEVQNTTASLPHPMRNRMQRGSKTPGAGLVIIMRRSTLACQPRMPLPTRDPGLLPCQVACVPPVRWTISLQTTAAAARRAPRMAPSASSA